MTSSQWFGRYGWFAFLSLFVPGLASAPWLHFVNRDSRSGRWTWVWSTLAAAVAFGIVTYLLDRNCSAFFPQGADIADSVVDLYICGAVATGLVMILTLLWALSPLMEIVGAVLRIFD